MFYACLSVLIMFLIMCFCVTIAIIDLETYNFGLYIVLLCIVGEFTTVLQPAVDCCLN